MVDDAPLFASVPTPTPGVDVRVSLATAMYAAPGVYAVLVGSGMSSAAGIPTGWQVVQHLIRNVARAEGISDEELGDAPEDWWVSTGKGTPRYDRLLSSLAPTDAARQSLLRGYFDPPPPVGPIEPTAAHNALAWLCATGYVRVVVTTNFDRLIERALEGAGAAPQVIASANAAEGMTPLVHARTTVIKLHGDWASLGMRNTPEELSEYPTPIRHVLDRVIDEYGLLVVGWSAEYDVALVDAISSCPSRRYPTYWTTYQGHLTESARRLAAQRPTAIIDTAGVDEFLPDLAERIGRLGQRAARQARPSPLRTYHFPPEYNSPPQGWAVLPLLQLRAAGVVSPATIDTCGVITPSDRDEVIKALRLAAFTQWFHSLGTTPALSAEATGGDSSESRSKPLGDWTATPGGHQSIDYASYRLGGDATEGLSALVTIRLPGVGTFGGAVVFMVDMAISVARFLRLGEVAILLREGLVLTSAILPDAIANVIPPDADVTQGELHLLAATTDGQNSNRPNLLTERIDLAPLGTPSRPLSASMGFAARLNGALTEQDAAEVVAEGVEQMALANGYLDPRIGINGLRLELGLALG